MKIILSIILLIPFIGLSQITINTPQPSGTAELCGDIQFDEAPTNTYFKDVYNTFDKYVGTWKYENGNDIVIFEIVKVTQKYDADNQIFEDYLVGNYNYSNDGGNTYVVNSIPSTISENRDDNTLQAVCQDNDTKITFGFKELIFNKLDGYCNAYFEFIPGSLTEITVSITNDGCIRGTIGDAEPFNYNFSIPTEMTVIKQ